MGTEDENERHLWVQAIYRATGQPYKPVPPKASSVPLKSQGEVPPPPAAPFEGEGGDDAGVEGGGEGAEGGDGGVDPGGRVPLQPRRPLRPPPIPHPSLPPPRAHRLPRLVQPRPGLPFSFPPLPLPSPPRPRPSGGSGVGPSWVRCSCWTSTVRGTWCGAATATSASSTTCCGRRRRAPSSTPPSCTTHSPSAPPTSTATGPLLPSSSHHPPRLFPPLSPHILTYPLLCIRSPHFHQPPSRPPNLTSHSHSLLQLSSPGSPLGLGPGVPSTRGMGLCMLLSSLLFSVWGLGREG